MDYNTFGTQLDFLADAYTDLRIFSLAGELEISDPAVVTEGPSRGALRTPFNIYPDDVQDDFVVSGWVEGRRNTGSRNIEQAATAMLIANITDETTGVTASDWVVKCETSFVLNPKFAANLTEQQTHYLMQVANSAQSRFYGGKSGAAGEPTLGAIPAVNGVTLRFDGLRRVLKGSYYIPSWARLVARVVGLKS